MNTKLTGPCLALSYGIVAIDNEFGYHPHEVDPAILAIKKIAMKGLELFGRYTIRPALPTS